MSALLPIRALTQHLSRQQHLSLGAAISLGVSNIAVGNKCSWAFPGVSLHLSCSQLRNGTDEKLDVVLWVPHTQLFARAGLLYWLHG